MPADRDELEAIIEALIEEARQRARRRRRRRGAYAVLAAVVGGGLYFGLDHGGGGTAAAPAARASSGGALAAAQTAGQRWGKAHGPDGGGAPVVAVAPSSPQVVYLGTWHGVFRSTNGGRNWVSAGSAGELAPGQDRIAGVTSLVVDPFSAGTVYAGIDGRWAGGMTYGAAVLKTVDSGRTWHKLPLLGEPIAITPTAVFALAGRSGGGGHLVKSSDGGHSWQAADAGLPRRYVWALAFGSTAPATMYAALGTSGVFVSSDGGSHWRAAGNSSRWGEVSAVAVDPVHTGTVYAATKAGIVASSDGGGSWRMLNTKLAHHGSDRWYMQVTSLLVDPVHTSTLYATTRCAGVFKTSNAGRAWSPVNAGLDPECPWTYSLALDPQAPRAIYAADPTRGVAKSTDGAAHWRLTNRGLHLSQIFSLAVVPGQGRTVYASAGQLGLFKSGDGGVNWRPLATGLKAVYTAAVDSANPRTVFAAGPNLFVLARDPTSKSGLARSTDGGETWTREGFGERWVNLIAVSGQTVYAGTSDGYGVYGSTNGGRSWRALGPQGAAYVQALAIEPGNPDVVYIGVIGKPRGLFKSTDGGSSWQQLDAPNVDATAIVIDPEDPTTIYIGTNGGEGGVLKSTDGGSTWQKANHGLTWRLQTRAGKWITSSIPISALAIDPAHSATLYAATNARGVFRSTDSGLTWHPLNTGLADRDVMALAVDTTGTRLYAGTSSGGVVSLQSR